MQYIHSYIHAYIYKKILQNYNLDFSCGYKNLAQLNVAMWKKEEEAKRSADLYTAEKKRTDVLEDLVKVGSYKQTNAYMCTLILI